MTDDQHPMDAFRIVAAATDADVSAARLLFREYATWLGVDLSFQDFDGELAGLPGRYAPPDGQLLLARCGDNTAGCVAVRKLDNRTCEMKRMWVRPEFRGRGVGRRLADNVISEARKIGYARMLLDSLPSLGEALALYRSLGFHEIPPYEYNTDPQAVFMRLDFTNLKISR